MVDSCGNKIFIHNLLTSESEFGKVTVPYNGSVRVREEGEVRCRLLIHTVSICVQVGLKLSRRARARRVRSGGIRAEQPRPCGLGRYSVDNGDALGLPDSFKVGEEECPVLDERAADCTAKLVPFEGRLRSGRVFEEIPCVQLTVAKEFVGAAMKSIGARARDCVDDPARRFAVLC